MYVCQGCKREVDPEDETLVRAAKQIRTPNLSSTRTETMDGERVFFHVGCWQSGNTYRRLD